MVKLTRILFLSLVVLLITTALTACSSAGDTPAPGADGPGISLSITGSTCPGVEINLNDQITWTNEDTGEHPLRVEYPDGAIMADLGVLQPGDSATVTFPVAGSYTYTCLVDQPSTGIITVLP